MKERINIINELNESNIIDFNDAKKQQMNKSLDGLVECNGARLINELNSIIKEAQDSINKIEADKSYDKIFIEDLMSINSELTTLYKDMFKEE